MNYSEQNDETLVSLVLAGNHHAYEGLVLHHEHRVLNAAYAVTQNHHMAEDAAQDHRVLLGRAAGDRLGGIARAAETRHVELALAHDAVDRY